MKKKKICFAASSGGHLEEIACLKPIAEKYDSFLLTEYGGFNPITIGEKTYYISQINRREKAFALKFLKLFFDSLRILLREKPDIIISTGALATCPICVIGKILGIKIIYIESFARVENASLTGRLIYKIADLFIVQWKELLSIYPNAVYRGSIF